MQANPDRELEREALRLCDRYLNEVVVGFGLCPWAEPALRAGRVGRAVCLESAPTPEACLAFLDEFAAAERPRLDIGLLIFPCCGDGWARFDGFAERIRRADSRRRAAGRPPPFRVAAFHPDGATHFGSAHQLISFLRRTPDPTLQLVRTELVDRLKENDPSVSEDVARHNYDALAGGVAEAGSLALDAVVRSIRSDRNTTYARLTS